MQSSRNAPALLSPAQAGAGWMQGLMGEMDDAGPGLGLAQRLVVGVELRVIDGRLAPGTKMPSVRALAGKLGISTFTVTESYSALRARSVLASRPGSGYYVLHRPSRSTLDDSGSTMQPVAEQTTGEDRPPPAEYRGDDLVREAMRRVARAAPDWDSGTRPSFGLPRLRELIATRHRAELPAMGPLQVMTAAGSLGAVMCLLQAWTGPGDAVLVESPAPRQLRRLIHTLGRRMLEVPRRGGCLDIGTLDGLAAQLPAASGQRLLLLSTAVSNPLGICMSPQGAHQALQAAEHHDLRVIELDTWRGLSPLQAPSLAAMDGLQRVAQVGGVSTTLSAKLRLAHVLLPQRWVDDPALRCLHTTLGPSEFEERVACEVLADASYPRFLQKLNTALKIAGERTLSLLTGAGLQALYVPDGGPFLCAGWPPGSEPRPTSDAVLQEARKQGLPLAAAADFGSTPQPFAWYRFNVAHCGDERLVRFLARMKNP
ncbi:PLP-dependent aminotransferase family protein [Variovorax sp. VaC1]|uniref:aminotransferase-like domain-containing protein n=1 Tax=Variovorax sp. VaC1 TaxID=3373132 RepID=UPI003748CFF6